MLYVTFVMRFSSILKEHEHLLEADLRRADAFIIMYSVTDKCSFDDTSRLKFLITYAKRRKKMGKELTFKVDNINLFLCYNSHEERQIMLS